MYPNVTNTSLDGKFLWRWGIRIQSSFLLWVCDVAGPDRGCQIAEARFGVSQRFDVGCCCSRSCGSLVSVFSCTAPIRVGLVPVAVRVGRNVFVGLLDRIGLPAGRVAKVIDGWHPGQFSTSGSATMPKPDMLPLEDNVGKNPNCKRNIVVAVTGDDLDTGTGVASLQPRQVKEIERLRRLRHSGAAEAGNRRRDAGGDRDRDPRAEPRGAARRPDASAP